MMGERLVVQESLFYAFRLEDHVPSDHLLRRIDRFVNCPGLRQHLAGFYSATGRPSIDPELMIRMLLIGYCLGIRSERRLCEEVHLNLAYRWFCRLGLEVKVPDHSTFSKNRHGRFRESDLFRHLFEAVVQRCLEEGPVGGEGFAVDASLIHADANKQRCLPGGEWVAHDHTQEAPRAVQEYLATLDEAAWGAATDVEPKFVSPSDPAAQWTGALRGPAFFAYADNYLIDLKSAGIVDVEASRAVRQAEVGAARTMLERTAERFGLKPERLAADSAYGSAEMLHWLVDEQKIEPHVPVIDKSERQDGTFSRADSTYDSETDTYTCPEGKTLTTSGRIVNEGTTRIYRGSTFDCGPCHLEEKCCPNTPARKIPRSIYEHAREVARALAGTPAYERSRQGRKRIEMLFAHLKRILTMGRLRLRGPCGAQDEFLLAATPKSRRTSLPGPTRSLRVQSRRAASPGC
jgi:transposase